MPRLKQSFDKVRLFQRKLYVKAKQEKNFRFYSLYDKTYRKDILQCAWQQCRSNNGAPGVGVSLYNPFSKPISLIVHTALGQNAVPIRPLLLCVISPLLANIALNKLDDAWYRPGGPFEKYNARLVKYADDFVIMARYIGAPIKNEVENIISSLGLNLNEKKTGIIDLKNGETLNFLGYDIRLRKNSNHVLLRPTSKACARLRARVREIISRERLYHGIGGIITEMNPVLRGWKQYFRMSNVKHIFWKLDYLISARFYRVCRKTSQRKSKIFKPGVFVTLKKLGLYSLAAD